MEIAKLDWLNQQSRETYINYTYFKGKMMSMRSRCPASKWLKCFHLHTSFPPKWRLQHNSKSTEQGGSAFPTSVSLLCCKYLITIKEMIFRYVTGTPNWNLRSLCLLIWKHLFHKPAEELSRDWEAAVTERTKRLPGISWGHSIVTLFTFKQSFDNECVIRYIYSRQQFELLSIRLANF